MPARWIGIGAAWGGLAVALGAFGAHALKDRIGATELEWWHTGVLYHALHAIGLVLYGTFRERGPGARTALGAGPGNCFLVGSVIFSGTLYAMALGCPHWLGMVTPVGGGLLIGGWVGFAVQAFRSPTRP